MRNDHRPTLPTYLPTLVPYPVPNLHTLSALCLFPGISAELVSRLTLDVEMRLWGGPISRTTQFAVTPNRDHT